MKIAIIGTGNVGGALATAWAKAGHSIFLGVRNPQSFKGLNLLQNPNTSVHPIDIAVSNADLVLIATPATMALEVAQSLGNTQGKIIVDSMNVVMGRGPEGFSNTAAAISSICPNADVVKCFNTTGFNNMENPQYGNTAIDVFMAGNSSQAKEAVRKLALDAGFAECYDVGDASRFDLMEQFAFFWINLAMMQGQGRNIAFKLLKR